MTVEHPMSVEQLQKLLLRIAELEHVLRQVPHYCENFEWEEDHYDILKTIPHRQFILAELEDRWEAEKAGK